MNIYALGLLMLTANGSCCFRGYKFRPEFQPLVDQLSEDYLANPRGPLSGNHIPAEIPLPYSQNSLSIKKLPADDHITWVDPIFRHAPPQFDGQLDVETGNTEEYSPQVPPFAAVANVRLGDGSLVPLNRKAANQLLKAAKLLQSAQASNLLKSLNKTPFPIEPFADVEKITATRIVLNNLLGPFPFESVSLLAEGDHPTVTSENDLTCDFSGDCCWHNMGGGSDDLQWMHINSSPNIQVASATLKGDRVPTPPFAATASGGTHSLVYGFLVSCPFLCTTGEGVLTFEHYTTDAVTIDVCILPLDSRNFNNCETIKTVKDTSSRVPIKKQSEPFVIVLVASEFTNLNGGVAAVDNIIFKGPVCSPTNREDELAQPVTDKPATLNDYEIPPDFKKDISFAIKHVLETEEIVEPDDVPQNFYFHNEFNDPHSGPYFNPALYSGPTSNGFILAAIRDRIPPEYFDLLQSPERSAEFSESPDTSVENEPQGGLSLSPSNPTSGPYPNPFDSSKTSDKDLIPALHVKIASIESSIESSRLSSVNLDDNPDYDFNINPADVLYGQGADYDYVCDVLQCLMRNGSLCHWKNSGDVSFIPVGKQFANWAAGVLKPKDGSNFLAAPIDVSGQVAIMESITFSPTVDFTISFKFFEAAYDISFRVCFDKISSSDTCQVFGRRAVTAADRAWREGRFTVPAGAFRKIFMVAEGHGNNRGAVGLYDVKVVEARTPSGLVRVDCQ